MDKSRVKQGKIGSKIARKRADNLLDSNGIPVANQQGDRAALPNPTVPITHVKELAIERIQGESQDQNQSPPKSEPQQMHVTGPITLHDLTAPANVVETTPPIKVMPNPFLGQVPDFVNAFKFSRAPEIKWSDYAYDTRIIGYSGDTPNIVLPSGWGVRLIENPPPMIASYTMSIFAEFKEESQFAVKVADDVDNLLLAPCRKAFRVGTNVAFFQLNEKLFADAGLNVEAGSITGTNFVAPFLISDVNKTIQGNVVQLVSGAIEAACVTLMTYYGLLILDKSKIHAISGKESIPTMNWLETNWTDLALPNPAMVRGLLGLQYVDDSITHPNLFRYGKVANLVLGPNNIPLVTKWASTYDNITVELFGIGQRYISANAVNQIRLEYIIAAHAPIGVLFPQQEVDQRFFRPIVISPPDVMLAQLFATIARQPSLKTVITGYYIDYLMHSGILFNSPPNEVLSGLGGNQLVIDIQREFYKRIGTGSFDSCVEALIFEIKPTFDFPLPDTQRPKDRVQQFMCLLETLLFFILFPKAAKFMAYELCNRIRYILKNLDPTSWNNYVANSGYWYNQPGTDAEISRESYLFNEHRPTLLYGARANNGWNLVQQIAGLITPIGENVPRDRAELAELPIFDRQIFVPWHDVGDGSYDGTEVTGRILLIMQFMNTQFMPLFKRVSKQSTAQMTGFGAVIAEVQAKASRIGNGLGRGCHRLFCGMVDFSTNVIHSYDGRLSTDIPGPIYMFDESNNRSVPMPVQSMAGDYQFYTGVVWTLVFHIEYVFDSSHLLNTETESGSVVAEFENPIQTMNQHLSIYSYAEQACIGIGIVNEILDPQNRNRSPYTHMYELLRVAKVDGQIMTSSSYKKLEAIISSRLAANTADKGQTITLPNINVSGDLRFGELVFRRATLIRTAIDPVNDDPPIIQGRPTILTEVYKSMFEYSATVLLDPISILSRVKTGFAIQQVTSPNVNFMDVYNPPNYPEVYITPLNFPAVNRDGSTVKGLQIDGVFYSNVNTVPQRIFIINEPGLLMRSALQFLCGVVIRNDSVLLFPNLKFIYTLQVVDRISYSRLMSKIDLVEFAVQASNSVAHITLYSTYQTASRLYTSTGDLIRYFFPLSAPKVTIAFRDMVELEPEGTYQGPSEALYDTGNLSADWRNTYHTALPKTYTNLSVANEVIYYERGEGYFEFPRVEVEIPTTLTQYQGNLR